MKLRFLLFIPFFVSLLVGNENEFRRELPPVEQTNALTADMFPGADAVIILKEQGYTEGPRTRSIFEFTYEIRMIAHRVIAKIFNEAAVSTFGSFEYEYPHRFFREAQHKFFVRARILKPDGSVWVLPENEIQTITGTESTQGSPLSKKVLFRLGNLAPGDVVQIEYEHIAPFSFYRRIIFPYHDRYPVLHSTVFIDMDKNEKVNFRHFPPDKIGEPETGEFRNYNLNRWTVSNLGQIPREPYSRPFYDVSYLTTIVNRFGEDRGWNEIARNYLNWNIKPGSVPRSFIRELGFDPSLRNPTWADIENLYTALRKFFDLRNRSESFTNADYIDTVIKGKIATASDHAYIMMKILERWGVPTTPLLIRDRREGSYEQSVPSLAWFDSLALAVSLDGIEMIYDFDRCIPSRFQYPWFLNGTTVLAITDTGAAHYNLSVPSNWQENTSLERHHVTIQPGMSSVDSVLITLKGAKAQRFRGDAYTLRGEALSKHIHSYVGKFVLENVWKSVINSFLDEHDINIEGVGTSQAAQTEIDSFLVFQPRNHLLREFREKFYSRERYDDIFLDEPFGYFFHWVVQPPTDYTVSHLPERITIGGVPGTFAQITYMLTESGSCIVRAHVGFMNEDPIESDHYREWLAFLDDAINSMEREIVSVKKLYGSGVTERN